MRVLFCKISYMRYYKGHCEADRPFNGGQYVSKTGYGHEEYNFRPDSVEGDLKECFGFVEPKSNNGRRNSFHLEKIEGCSAMKNAPCVDDVLVIWCAANQWTTTVVGWYKHATVWRRLRDWDFVDGSGEEDRCYNVRAKSSDCTLLPVAERNKPEWEAPMARNPRFGFGFGQSMVWYPTGEKAQPYLAQLTEGINNYHGENWLYKFPEA